MPDDLVATARGTIRWSQGHLGTMRRELALLKQEIHQGRLAIARTRELIQEMDEKQRTQKLDLRDR
jgi:hypothetical protein